MRKINILFWSFFLAASLSAHPWKPQHYVIVDTDCGFDDFRALCLLLASPDVRVLGITTSDGVLEARTGLDKVRALLHDLHHEGILTGFRSDPDIRAESCVAALQLEWGEPQPTQNVLPDAVDVVRYIVENTRERITFISLGSLRTVNLCIAGIPGFSTRINRILWSNTPAYPLVGFNYDLDQEAAHSVLSGKIPALLISGGFPLQYEPSLFQTLAQTQSPCTEKVLKSLITPGTPFANTAFDESAVLFLHSPELFQADAAGHPGGYQWRDGLSTAGISSALNHILTAGTRMQNQVFAVFPTDTSLYFTDVRSAMSEILSRYGQEEWIAGVLANEMHRHLGIYSIIGMKMGMRAKEYFGAGVDEMQVISYAGLVPPFSCLNDGLQVSTGATLGHGLIRVASDSLMLPQADFVYLNRKIRLTLKPGFRSGIESEIRELSRIYGLDSNIYWELVRKAAIRYWATLDRHEIFLIQVIP